MKIRFLLTFLLSAWVLCPGVASSTKLEDSLLYQTVNSSNFVNSVEQRLVDYVHKTVAGIRYTAYKLGGNHFDPKHGIYVVDCSSYVDDILKKVTPHAFYSLVHSTGTNNPSTWHYYEFFTRLSQNSHRYWNKIEDVSDLRPGDILVLRYKKTQGHIMVVMKKPVREHNSFAVRVADSSPYRHSLDTRVTHKGGIGIGTLLLKVDPYTGLPNGYAWQLNSSFRNHVNFAMARPVEV